MYKIKHIKTGKYFSTPGKRYWELSIGGYTHDEKLKQEYPITKFLTNNGATWSTKRGVNYFFDILNKYFPNQFEIAVFKEV